MIPIRPVVLCSSLLLVLAGCSSGGVGAGICGQVSGNVGVGASVPLGDSGVRAGVGVGTGTVIYDPKQPPPSPAR